MQKYLFLLYLGVIYLTPSYAQNLLESQRRSSFTYIFELNEQEAENLYKHSMEELSEEYFHTLVDSFPSNDVFNSSLKEGHYIFVEALGSDLICELKTISEFSIHYLNNQRDLAFVVQNAKGDFVSTAQAEVRNRKVPFDEASKTYRLPKYKKEGFLKVEIGNETLYEHIEARSYYYRGRPQSGFFYQAPVRFLWKPPLDFLKGSYFSIRDRQPYGWVQWFANIFDPYHREDYLERINNRRYQGYIAFNQPIYKPGDSVKFKAFITRKGKRLFNKDIRVYLGDHDYDSDPRFLAEIHPYQAGGYTYEFVLHDSLDLKLDEFYSIILKRGNKVLQRRRFKYEDYELKRNTFELRVSHEAHKKGVSQIVYVNGKDENDLNLLDARVELFILTEKVQAIYGEEVFIPDTLWIHQQKLDEIGETSMAIPDSILPNASMDYIILAHFYNTENELHIEDATINYDAAKDWLDISEEGDSLSLKYMVGGKSQEKEALIEGFLLDQEQIRKDSITLPTKYPIEPHIRFYDLHTESLRERHRIDTRNTQKVSFFCERTKDSVYINIQNPLNLPVWYQLYNGDKEILQGVDRDFQHAAKTSGKNPYTLCWQYMWGGEMLDESVEILHVENRLDIAFEHPTKIYPGQEVEIGLLVKNTDGNPVSNVDMTAYGIKSTFPNHSLPNIPAWENKRKTKLKGYSFEKRAYFRSESQKDLNYNFWRKLMRLDSIAYYQFLYPSNGMFRFSYPTPDSITQFAPFVFLNGNLQRAELIYVDQTPVYVGQVGNIQPYSFAIDSGYHKIEIRTPSYFITLDSIYFEPKLKHILSIEADSTKAFIEKRPQVLSEQEFNRILPYLMVVQRNLQSNFSYLKQGERIFPMVGNYHSRRENGSILIGPILPQTFTYYHRYDSTFSLMTHFEPYFEYEFQPQLMKMRAFDKGGNDIFGFSKALDKKYNYYWSYDQRTGFDELLQKEQEIDKQWLAYKASFIPTSNPTYTKIGNGKIRVELNLPDSLELRMIFLLANDNPEKFRVYGENARFFHDFPPNTYNILYLLSDSSFVYLPNILVQPDGLTYVKVKDPQYQYSESLANLMRMVIAKRLSKKENFEEDFSSESSITPIQNNRYYPILGDRIRGQVLDENGNPLIGASVLVKGTTIGVFTDENGYFDLTATSIPTLVISYVGFRSQDVDVRGQRFIRSNLEAADLALDEVIVTGYGTAPREEKSLYWIDPMDQIQPKKSLTGVVQGISIQNFYRILEKEPLVVVDGIPYDGKFDDLDQSMMGKIETLKGIEAMSLYGSRASNGVVIVTTGAGVDLNLLTENNLQPQQAYSLRSNFSDYAFWKPKLRTDDEGKVSFRARFPDDITKWQLYAMGMDGYKHTGISGSEIKSFKPIMAQLAMPLFLVEGDSINILGKIQNYSSDTLEASMSMEIDEQRLWEKRVQIQSSAIDTIAYQVKTTDSDSVSFTYKLELADGYMDGEKRQVPILPKGVTKTKGHYFTLHKDTTIFLSLENDVEWTMSVYSDPITIIQNEVKHIRNYRYLCNEQIASKLKALLAEERISNWKGEKFKRQSEVNRLQKRLSKNKQADQFWGWWAQSPKDYWVSKYVLNVLIEAKTAGYVGDRYWDLYSFKQVLLNEVQNTENESRLFSLEMLINIDSTTNYLKWINDIESGDSLNFNEKVRLSILRQKLNQKVDVSFVFEEQKETLLGNIYWGEEAYNLEESAISTTLYVYQLLKRSGEYAHLLPSIRAYFFERLEGGHWRNTYESAQIISSILPDIISSYREIEPAELKISGNFSRAMNAFPFDTSFYATKTLNIQKSGTAPVYLSLFHPYRESQPEKKADLFEIKSELEGNQVSTTDSSTWKVRAGKPVILKVYVEVKKKSEYVMIEVPIPSGCSYYRKKRVFNGIETHREHFKDRTSIFCSDLPAGKYTFEVELLPRYSGSFTLNPVRVEQMYFPVFDGNNEIQRVVIE